MRDRRSREVIVCSVLLAIGLLTTVRGQMDGTDHRAPDPVERMTFAIVPFVILTGALVWLTRSRGQAVVLAVVAVFMWASSAMYTNDEMRLSYWIVPVVQIGIALPVVGGLAIHAWWQWRSQRARGRPS